MDMANSDNDPSLKYWIAADKAWAKAKREGKGAEHIISCVSGAAGFCRNCAWPMEEDQSIAWHMPSMVNLKVPVTGMMQNTKWTELQHVCSWCVKNHPSGDKPYRGRFYRPHLLEEYNKRMQSLFGEEHMWIVPS